YDPQEGDKRFRWLVSPREMSAPPAAFAGGILTPCVNGQVFLLDPAGAQDSLAKAYAPSVSGVDTWEWKSPQAVDAKSAVLCDGDRRMILIRLGEGAASNPVDAQPEPGALSPELTDVAAPAISKQPLVSPIAVNGKAVFVVDAANN